MRQNDAYQGVESTGEVGGGTVGLGMVSLLTGCAYVAWSGFFSCVMLVVNGAFVMAMLAALAAGGSTWVIQPGTQQFFLFAVPAGLLILQWVMIDYIWWLLRRRWYGRSQYNDDAGGTL